MRKVEKAEAAKKVREVAELLGVAHLLERMPQGLSGGESQKVSLARALVLKPRVLLLDEPVSAIDEENRDAICRELKSVQRLTGITTIHVSHSRREAELVADATGVMRGGVLSEIAVPGTGY